MEIRFPETHEGCQNFHAQLSDAACSENRVLGLFLRAPVPKRCRPHRSASTLCWARCLIVGKTPETLQASFNSGWSMSTWTRFYRCLHARTGLTEQTDGCLFACGRPRPGADTFKQPVSTALLSCLSLFRVTLHDQGKSATPRVRGSAGSRAPWC